jgi:hypothetical protein
LNPNFCLASDVATGLTHDVGVIMKRILLVLPFLLGACDSGLTGPSKSLVPTAASLSVSGGTCTLATGDVSTGFNQYGYNYCARIFNGTGSSWCLAREAPLDCLGSYSGDKLVMKWNAAWDACNASPSPDTCAGAWTDNEWNGKTAGGSGEVWHYKIQWSQACADGSFDFVPGGGYCVWGSYEVLMDQGIDPSMGPGHIWFALAIPNGYGT